MKKNGFENQLYDAINIVKQLCLNGPDGGAIFLLKASIGEIKDLRKDIPKYFQKQPKLAKEFLQVLEMIHNLCSKDENFVKLVKQECADLIRFQAIKDTITGSKNFQELVSGKGSMER
jgi:hypothetical protein